MKAYSLVLITLVVTCQMATGFKIVRGIYLEDFRQVHRAFIESGFTDLPNANRLINKLVDHAEFLNDSGIDDNADEPLVDEDDIIQADPPLPRDGVKLATLKAFLEMMRTYKLTTQSNEVNRLVAKLCRTMSKTIEASES